MINERIYIIDWNHAHILSKLIPSLYPMVALLSPLVLQLCMPKVMSDLCLFSPTSGCDDLLPILSYVIIKSSVPEIVSECSAMEEFIHEG